MVWVVAHMCCAKRNIIIELVSNVCVCVCVLVGYPPRATQRNVALIHLAIGKQLRHHRFDGIEMIKLGLCLLQTEFAATQKGHKELIILSSSQMRLLGQPIAQCLQILWQSFRNLVQLRFGNVAQFGAEWTYLGHNQEGSVLELCVVAIVRLLKWSRLRS